MNEAPRKMFKTMSEGVFLFKLTNTPPPITPLAYTLPPPFYHYNQSFIKKLSVTNKKKKKSYQLN